VILPQSRGDIDCIFSPTFCQFSPLLAQVATSLMPCLALAAAAAQFWLSPAHL